MGEAIVAGWLKLHGLRCSDRVVCYTNETQIFKLFQLGAYEYPS